MKLNNSYKALGESFYHSNNPMPVSNPSLVIWNTPLSQDLGLTDLSPTDTPFLAEAFSGNRLLDGSEPISIAYAGHQFGHFNPQLGDGRAHLLGDVQSPQGQIIDIQLKGSGPSAFSRSGDGRCTLSAAMREYIMSEAMHALGVPTTRVLAVVRTGEPVYREEVQPGAVVTRTASSHIRVGTFQYFASRGDFASLKALADYTIERHYPKILDEGSQFLNQPYIGLLDAVIQSQIELIVHWMRVGFIHGVMNTDNTAVSGETIDYGPCAMMGTYNPETVFSSIDRNGRYAFGNQFPIMHWNMTRFAECLLYLVDREDKAIFSQFEALIQGVTERFDEAYNSMMAAKLGFEQSNLKTEQLVSAILDDMESGMLDYTQTFHELSLSINDSELSRKLSQLLPNSYSLWSYELKQNASHYADALKIMQQTNPVVIPRNHDVERVLKSVQENEVDHSELGEFLDVICSPYTQIALTERYQQPPKDGDSGYKTYCGT